VRLDQDASSSPLVEELASPDRIVLLRGVTKLYGEHAAVDNVDLEIRRGEFFTILGPSGSGKTTILRMIAGLIEPTAGQIFIDDKDVVGRKPYERDISMVFQSLALFPHMDVFSNIAFPLRMRRIGREGCSAAGTDQQIGVEKFAGRAETAVRLPSRLATCARGWRKQGAYPA